MKITIDTNTKSILFDEPVELNLLKAIMFNLSSSLFKDEGWMVLPQKSEEKKFNYFENNG